MRPVSVWLASGKVTSHSQTSKYEANHVRDQLHAAVRARLRARRRLLLGVERPYLLQARRGVHPYSRTGPGRALPSTFGPWALNLDFLNSRQRLGQTLNLLRFRVRLSEYYNFGRIEPGRHGCFFGLENGHLRPQIIIFPAARPL